MQDINRPIVCKCGSDRFLALKQYNTTCCELASDAEENPVEIQCANCGARWKQTPDWGWESTRPFGISQG